MSETDVDKLAHSTASLEEFGHVTQRESKRRRVMDESADPESVNIETTDPESVSIRTIIREELREMISVFQSQQNTRLDVLEKHIYDIKSQNDTTLIKTQDIEKSIEFATEKVNEVQLTINRLEEDRKQLTSQIANIQTKCDSLERLSRKTSIQIRNVPRQKGEKKENLFNMIGKLSSTIGVTLEATELRDVYRLPTKPDQANTALVAEFSSTLIRDNFLTAAKNHKLASIRYKTEQLNSSHLGLEGSNSDIYISEHLTPLASRLFFLAREFRKTMGYDYCWTSNGLVYLRKKQGEPYVLIKSEDQLHLLKNK